MISARAIWRLLVLPVYMLIAGAVFALALRNTAGSILSSLAPLAPWVMLLAGLLALVAIAGGVLRWRRRLTAVRAGRANRMPPTHAPQNSEDWDGSAGTQNVARS